MSQQLISSDINNIKTLYDKYGAMLLGYLYEVVKDHDLAEQYLIEVFNQIPSQLNYNEQPIRLYLRLQVIARKLLAGHFETETNYPSASTTYAPTRPNKLLEGMDSEQQLVFCNVYYCGKSISTLATELNRTESDIKQILKAAFAAMRRLV